MMSVLWVLGFGSFTLASLVVGARLLALAARTRGLAEAAFGTSLFLGGAGYVLLVLAFRVVAIEQAPLLLAVGNLLLHVGSMTLLFGTWRVFRPSERWPAAIVTAIGTALAVSFAIRLARFTVIPPPASVFWISTIGGAAAYLWSTGESLRFWSMMRRREALGLADRATTQRFGSWGLCTACAVGMHVASMLGRALAGDAMPPLAVIASSGLGVVAAISLWLAFFPRLAGGRSEGVARVPRAR
jgi:hypothetical protein